MRGTGRKKRNVWVNPNSQRRIAETVFGEQVRQDSATKTENIRPHANSETGNTEAASGQTQASLSQVQEPTVKAARAAAKAARQAERLKNNPDIQELKKAISEGTTDIRFPEGAPEHTWIFLAKKHKRNLRKKVRNAEIHHVNRGHDRIPWEINDEDRENIMQNHFGRGVSTEGSAARVRAMLRDGPVEDPVTPAERAMKAATLERPAGVPRRSERLLERDISNSLAGLMVGESRYVAHEAGPPSEPSSARGAPIRAKHHLQGSQDGGSAPSGDTVSLQDGMSSLVIDSEDIMAE